MEDEKHNLELLINMYSTQSFQEIQQLVKLQESALERNYMRFSNCRKNFEEEIVAILPTSGLFYAEPQWENNLYIVTKEQKYIPFYSILESFQWQDIERDQPYCVYLKGLISILSVYKYSIQVKETLKFALHILQKGRIAGILHTKGCTAGKWSFLFSNGYGSWI